MTMLMTNAEHLKIDQHLQHRRSIIIVKYKSYTIQDENHQE